MPKKTGLANKLREFFKANPGEELTRMDIALKFDANPETVSNVLHHMKKAGEIEAAHVYRRAPGRHGEEQS